MDRWLRHLFQIDCASEPGSEEDVGVEGAVRRVLRQRHGDNLLRCLHSVGAWCSGLGQRLRDELSSCWVNVLDGHELLVPDDLLCAIRGRHA